MTEARRAKGEKTVSLSVFDLSPKVILIASDSIDALLKTVIESVPTLRNDECMYVPSARFL